MDSVIKVVGRVDALGHLEAELPPGVPPGEVWLTVEVVTPEMLAAEDAAWEEAIAQDPEKLDRLLAEGLQGLVDGSTDELNPDDMLP